MITIKMGDQSYTDVFETVEWNGSIKTSCRSLEATYLKDKAKFELGKEVKFIVDDLIVFVGTVFSIKMNTEEETYTMKAYDNAIRLNKNFFIRNYYETLPSQIITELLGSLKIEVGEIPVDRAKCTFPALDRSAYDIILTAYKIQAMKDNKVYSIISENNRISVVEQGILIPDLKLISGKNIRRASYEEDIEEMINKIIIYKTENNTTKNIGIKSNEDDIKKYGIFQRVQEQDQNNEVYLQVNKMLKGVFESSDIEVDGNIYLMSGYSVPVKVNELSPLNNNFLIETDRHLWTSNDYVTYISLAFENEIQDIDIPKYPTRKKYKKEETKMISTFDTTKAGIAYE
jgi:hypothetical protein